MGDHTIQVSLSISDDTLRLYNTDAWAPNLDRVTIAPVVVGKPTTDAARGH